VTHGHQKPDANRAEIVDAARRIGCGWWDLPDACDGLLLSRQTGLHIVEIKTPKTRDDLTKRERLLQCMCLEMGIPYNIVTSVDELISLAGLGVVT